MSDAPGIASGAPSVAAAADGDDSNANADDRLRQNIFDFVAARDFVTFAALHRHFAGDAREATEIALPGGRVIWRGLPLPVINAVLALLDAQQLAAIPAPVAAYRRDGRVLPLPIEKRPPREPHKTPHWFPVLLRTMEAVQAEG